MSQVLTLCLCNYFCICFYYACHLPQRLNQCLYSRRFFAFHWAEFCTTSALYACNSKYFQRVLFVCILFVFTMRLHSSMMAHGPFIKYLCKTPCIPVESCTPSAFRVKYNRVKYKSLKNVETWCREWQMEINTEKTVAMSIPKKKTKANFSYSLGNVPLRNVASCKYLGILISSDLNWTAHVEHIQGRLSAGCFFLSEPFVIRHPKQKF